MTATIANDKNRISIQVALSGYSFKVYDGHSVRLSGWQKADRIFVARELKEVYDAAEVSVFTPKFTLYPESFFDGQEAREYLAAEVELDKDDRVMTLALPSLGATLIYSLDIGESLSKVICDMVKCGSGKPEIYPEIYYMLQSLPDIQEYNKVIASYADGWLYLVLSMGNTLQLCNAFRAEDFTSALYFLFLSMKKLQFNPEITTVFFRTPLDAEQEMVLYRYFKSVEQI